MEAIQEVTSDFLGTGACFGNKRCKKRRSARRKRRSERKTARHNKKIAKKSSKVEDARYKKLANDLLSQTLQPQQVQQAKQKSVQAPNLQNAANPTQKSNNTALFIGGGIGTLVIIGLILFIVLKK